MILDWMLYACAGSALVAAAALAAERAVRGRGRPARWVWVGSLLLGAALATLPWTPLAPLASRLTPITLSRTADTSLTWHLLGYMSGRHSGPATGAGPEAGVGAGLRTGPGAGTMAGEGASDVAADPAGGNVAYDDVAMADLAARLDALLLGLWALLTSALALGVAAAAVRIARERRRWSPGEVSGKPVLVSETRGPAVVGFARPAVLLPRWVFGLEPDRLALILAHEHEHVRAGDQWLRGLSIALLVLAPWNPALWWQLRRLWQALEIDCDARVIRAGASPKVYGSLLLEVSRRPASRAVPLAAFAETSSSLERRIRAMSNPVGDGARIGIALALMALVLTGASLALPRPAVNGGPLVVERAAQEEGGPAVEGLAVQEDGFAAAREAPPAAHPALPDQQVPPGQHFRADQQAVLGPTGEIVGTVFAADGEPFGGVVVAFGQMGLVTMQNGRFVLLGVPAGTGHLRIRPPTGQVDHLVEVEVLPQRRLELSLAFRDGVDSLETRVLGTVPSRGARAPSPRRRSPPTRSRRPLSPVRRPARTAPLWPV